MDAKKFGTFIASLRKENNMTQADLAKKLQVTDKATGYFFKEGSSIHSTLA